MTDVEREMGLPPIEQKPGLQIWTIKNMKMEPIPAKAYGSFFEGDCYIILNNTKMQHRFATDLHFWIGRDASQDEQGAAAFYVTQMDDSLQGMAIQHREVQGHESAAFKSYFKKGIIYKKGGLASGFKHVETNMYNIKRLLHVKGKKHVSATEVDLSWDNFNKGDVFLLDLGKVLIQWNGPSCNIAEKSKGMILARNIRDGERGGRAQIAVIDNEKDCPELMQIMKATLGERNQEIREPLPDEKADEHQKANVRLYHVYENGKDLVVQEIATRPLTQDLLSHEDCHIIDQGGLKIYVWRGKESSKEEKNAAFSRAVGALTTRPNWLMLCERCIWVSFQVWRIENREMVPVNPKTYGQFYGGDCYLVLYTYTKSGRPHYIIYMWQGRHASVDETTACAINAVELDKKYGDEPVQVRVTMGKEPRHFLAIFKGNLIIYEGGIHHGQKTEPEPGVQLFQVRGTDEFNTKTVEVPARASSLNSNDVFLLKTNQVCYLWCGKGCSGDEREMAKTVADVISKWDKQTVMEGQEPAEFWFALGGKAPYASGKRFQEQVPHYQARLFECSNQTGRFIMTEIVDFGQDDLDEEDVMLLDTWEEIFLWVGKTANSYEKTESVSAAKEYLKNHPAGRDVATPIITVKQGHEPLNFTGWFTAWDPYKWSDGKSYEQMKSSLGDVSAISEITMDLKNANFSHRSSSNKPVTANAEISEARSSLQDNQTLTHSSNCYNTDTPLQEANEIGTFPRDLLINKTVDELPEGVDPTKKEYFLSDAEFFDIFGKTKDAFYQMPTWKQQNEKKQLGLF
ncbi:villin-1-like [Notechis scutatus]|uniref:Villin-1-like n=1 Tax=Notechis scutatus TaxID=8663 RepID=A0A6J1UUN2_9SAUR|nr:villin-1-like [Notechis scutatus]